MKAKHLFLSLAALWLGAACSNDEIDDGADSPTLSKANEIQLIIGGSGESVEYTKATTKGIASESENKIENMMIYVFASDKANGTTAEFFLMEKWVSEGLMVEAGDKSFTLQPSGSEWKASIKPVEWKDKPYLKLYCITNSGKIYAEDGTDKAIQRVALDPDTHVGAEAGVTTEADFLQSYTVAQMADINIHTPLPMSGVGATKIVGSVSKVKIELKRAVVRFDIDNTSRSSNFIIESVTMKHGRKTAPLMPEGTITPVAQADLDTDAKLMTYHEVDYLAFDHANEGITESAIYVNPGLLADEPTLVLKGKYISPTTGLPADASYNVPIQRTDDAGNTPFINIERNNRYKLRIIDVTSTSLKATFEIEDWVNDGKIDIKPTDTKPTFDLATMFDKTDAAATQPTNIMGMTNAFRLPANNEFTMTVSSTSGVGAKIISHDGHDWVTFVSATQSANPDGNGYYTTDLVFKVDNTPEAYPTTITLYNETSPDDPDTQTTLMFYTQQFAPVLVGKVASSPNTNVVDHDAHTITMASLIGSYVSFEVVSAEGINEINTHDIPAGFSLTWKESDPYTWIYTLRVTDPTKVTGTPTFTLVNAGNPALETEITIIPEISAATVATVGANATIEDAGKTIRLDVASMKAANALTSTGTLNIPYGSTITSPTPDWVTVEVGEASYPAGISTLKLTLNDAYAPTGAAGEFADAVISIKNKTSGATDEITVKAKGGSKPTLKPGDDNIPTTFDPTVDPGTGEGGAAFEAKDGNYTTFDITCDGGVEIKTVPNGLTVTPNGSIYKITVTDATQWPTGGTAEVIFANKTFPALTQKVVLQFPMP